MCDKYTREYLLKMLSLAGKLHDDENYEELEILMAKLIQHYEHPNDFSIAPNVEFMMGAILIDLGSELFARGRDKKAKDFVSRGICLLEFEEKNFPKDEKTLTFYII